MEKCNLNRRKMHKNAIIVAKYKQVNYTMHSELIFNKIEKKTIENLYETPLEHPPQSRTI